MARNRLLFVLVIICVTIAMLFFVVIKLQGKLYICKKHGHELKTKLLKKEGEVAKMKIDRKQVNKLQSIYHSEKASLVREITQVKLLSSITSAAKNSGVIIKLLQSVPSEKGNKTDSHAVKIGIRGDVRHVVLFLDILSREKYFMIFENFRIDVVGLQGAINAYTVPSYC